VAGQQHRALLLADFDGSLARAEDQVVFHQRPGLPTQTYAAVVVDAAQLVVTHADLAVTDIDCILLGLLEAAALDGCLAALQLDRTGHLTELAVADHHRGRAAAGRLLGADRRGQAT